MGARLGVKSSATCIYNLSNMEMADYNVFP